MISVISDSYQRPDHENCGSWAPVLGAGQKSILGAGLGAGRYAVRSGKTSDDLLTYAHRRRDLGRRSETTGAPRVRIPARRAPVRR